MTTYRDVKVMHLCKLPRFCQTISMYSFRRPNLWKSSLQIHLWPIISLIWKPKLWLCSQGISS